MTLNYNVSDNLFTDTNLFIEMKAILSILTVKVNLTDNID